MADITMCEGKECPMKQNCYRHTAKPNEFRQSYFMHEPIKQGHCMEFVDNGNHQQGEQ
jgi:hypothetical protein